MIPQFFQDKMFCIGDFTCVSNHREAGNRNGGALRRRRSEKEAWEDSHSAKRGMPLLLPLSQSVYPARGDATARHHSVETGEHVEFSIEHKTEKKGTQRMSDQ